MSGSRVILLVAVAVIASLLLSAGATALAAFVPETEGRGLRATPAPKATGEADETEADAAENPEQVTDAIATAFGVSPDEIRARHDAGLGFGEIYRAYDLSRASGQPVDSILAERAAGKGWGELYRAAGLNPGGRGLGSVVGQGKGHGRGQREQGGGPNKP